MPHFFPDDLPALSLLDKNVSAAQCSYKMNLRAALKPLIGNLFTLFLG
jgi:hypothetical protein